MHLRLLPMLLLATCAVARGEPAVIPAPGLHAPKQPQVAVGADDTVHVVFGDGPAIYATSARAADLSFAHAEKIGELPKLALGMRCGPRIVAAGDTLIVTAISHEDGRVRCWLSADAGKTWREREPLNTVAKSAVEGFQSMAANRDGFVVCVWSDLRDGKMSVWSRVSRDAGATWEPEARVYAAPDGPICPCCPANVALGPRGQIAAMWRNALGGARDLWTATSTDGGRTFPDAHKLGTGTWMLQTCPMDGGGLAFSADGKLHTTWRRESTVFASGTSGAETALAENAAQPFVVSNGEKIATLWDSGGAVWVRVEESEARKLAEPAQMAAAAPLGVGFVAVWEEPHGKKLRLRAEKFD